MQRQQVTKYGEVPSRTLFPHLKVSGFYRLAEEDVPHGATQFKLNPPLRHESHRLSLWAALREGVIDVVTSHDLNKKKRPRLRARARARRGR